MRPKLSLVLPIFNEEAVIPELHRRLKEFLANLPHIGNEWEVLFVDDGSRDKSRSMLKALAAAEPRYKVLGFSRNLGHQLPSRRGWIVPKARPSSSWTPTFRIRPRSSATC